MNKQDLNGKKKKKKLCGALRHWAEADPLMQTQPLEVPPALQTRKPPNSAARPISAPQFRDEEVTI